MATRRIVNVQVVHKGRHVKQIRLMHQRDRSQKSSLTGRGIPGLRPTSSRTVRNEICDPHIRPPRPAIRPILCLGTMQLDLIDVDVIRVSENKIGQISCSQINHISTQTAVIADPAFIAAYAVACVIQRPVCWRQFYGVGSDKIIWKDTISCFRRKSNRNMLSG